MHTDAEQRSRSFLWWRMPATVVGPKASRRRAMTHVFVWAASLRILLVWTREGGTRERLAELGEGRGVPKRHTLGTKHQNHNISPGSFWREKSFVLVAAFSLLLCCQH